MKRTGLFIVCVALLLAGSVLAGSGTIILKSGKSFQGVNYTPDPIKNVLVIESGGWTQKIERDKIDKVLDTEGRDVTADVMAAFNASLTNDLTKAAVDSTQPPADTAKAPAATARPPVPAVTAKETWLSRDDGRRRRWRGKPFDIAIGGRANFSIPFGDYYEGLTSGVGFEGDLRVAITRELALMFLVSRSGMRVAPGYQAWMYMDYPYVFDRVDLSMTTMRYYFGLMETHRAGGRLDNPNLWYVYFAVGGVAHRGKATLYYHDQNTLQNYVLPGSPTTDTKFGNVTGMGYIVNLSETVGLDFAASFEGVWMKVYYANGTQSVGMKGFSFDIKAGVIFLIGGSNR